MAAQEKVKGKHPKILMIFQLLKKELQEQVEHQLTQDLVVHMN